MELPNFEVILCPTDFSPFARRAFDYAVALGRLYKARIETVYVHPPLLLPFSGSMPYLPEAAPVDEKARAGFLDDLNLFVEPARKAGIPVEVALLEGDPSDRIAQRAWTNRADLIVMGTHGLRGLERWLLGSVTERVLRKASCPVLTVKPGGGQAPEDVALKTILCALDLSPHSEETLGHALSLARTANATLLVHHVVEDAPLYGGASDVGSEAAYALEHRRRLEERARAHFESIVPSRIGDVFGIERVQTVGTPYQEILHIAAERRVSLIVLGMRGPKAVGSFLGSTAQHVVRGAECPVLTVRAPMKAEEA